MTSPQLSSTTTFISFFRVALSGEIEVAADAGVVFPQDRGSFCAIRTVEEDELAGVEEEDLAGVTDTRFASGRSC